jgi:transcriptional regulator
MYVAKSNRNENIEELHEFIRQNGFCILFSTVEGKPWATHVPLILSPDGKKLSGHLAKGNKQWKDWNDETEVLAVFSGSHTYISSSWYDHENVPTWNYIAVHASGTLRILSQEELIDSLKSLTNKYEKASKHPVTVEGMSKDYLSKELLGIVGFEITITKLEAAYKLSQNRDDKNYKEIIHQLNDRLDTDSHKIAEEMAKLRNLNK